MRLFPGLLLRPTARRGVGRARHRRRPPLAAGSAARPASTLTACNGQVTKTPRFSVLPSEETSTGVAVMSDPLRVLFVCTGNGARSQMAEALLRQLTHGRVEAQSCGPDPVDGIHPAAVKAMHERFDVDLTT